MLRGCKLEIELWVNISLQSRIALPTTQYLWSFSPTHVSSFLLCTKDEHTAGLQAINRLYCLTSSNQPFLLLPSNGFPHVIWLAIGVFATFVNATEPPSLPTPLGLFSWLPTELLQEILLLTLTNDEAWDGLGSRLDNHWRILTAPWSAPTDTYLDCTLLSTHGLSVQICRLDRPSTPWPRSMSNTTRQHSHPVFAVCNTGRETFTTRRNAKGSRTAYWKLYLQCYPP